MDGGIWNGWLDTAHLYESEVIEERTISFAAFADVNPSKWEQSRGEVSVVRTTPFLIPYWTNKTTVPSVEVGSAYWLTVQPNTWEEQGRLLTSGWESHFWPQLAQWSFVLDQIVLKRSKAWGWRGAPPPTPPQVTPSATRESGAALHSLETVDVKSATILVQGKVGYCRLIWVGKWKHKTVLTAI